MSRTIVISGGGSGGHTTPLVAIANDLKELGPDLRIVFIGQRNDRFFERPASSPHISKSYQIFAGKLRRYHSIKLYNYKFREHLKNARDLIFIFIGVLQSLVILRREKLLLYFLKAVLWH